MNISDTFSDGDFVPPEFSRGFQELSPRFDCECDHTNTNRDGCCTICGGAVAEEAKDCDWIFLLPCFGLMLICLWAALFLKR